MFSQKFLVVFAVLLVGTVTTSADFFFSHNNYNEGLTMDSDDKTWGSVYNFSEDGHTVGITASGVYFNLTVNNTGELRHFKKFDNIPYANTGTRLMTEESGLFAVDAVVTIGSLGGDYGMGVSTNNANPEVLGRCYTTFSLATGVQAPIAVTCFKRLRAFDNVTIVFDDEASPVKDLKIYTVNLRLFKIGDYND